MVQRTNKPVELPDHDLIRWTKRNKQIIQGSPLDGRAGNPLVRENAITASAKVGIVL